MSKFWSLWGANKLTAWQGNHICTIYLYQNWKPLCWNLKIHDRLILISTEGVLFWGSMLNLLISKLPSTNDCVQLPCRILKKIRLICRLTKRGDQALISISTITRFPNWGYPKSRNIYIRKSPNTTECCLHFYHTKCKQTKCMNK